MPSTALTGQWGQPGTQLGLAQLGGPAYMQQFDRLLPTSTRPLIGHVFGNNGVTPVASFSPLNRPVITATTANGGFNQVLLSVEKPVAGIGQGNVVRLTEQGGDGSFIYSGIVEDLPDSLRTGAVEHQILLSPPGYELDDTDTQLLYTNPVDVAQMVRDAVAVTNHLHCDQTSCPAWTNILAATEGNLDFRNQPAKQVLESARSIAGPTWFWFVDEQFRVWFQSMGSGAVYTIPRNQYEERTAAASIQNRKNRVVTVGGVPAGGSANVQAIANDSVSQASIGIRALAPPISLPHITDQITLNNISANILSVLNRVWNRVNLKLNPSYGRRVHGSWPGGAMMRYWEPSKSPLQEGVQGIGNYSNNYICQSVTNDGLNQRVVAGDIPVTSQTDITNMSNSLWARHTAIALKNTAATLNLSQQVFSGSLVSGTASVQGSPATQWNLDPNLFQAYDPSGVSRAQMGDLPANGNSPAQWGFRANDASGNPIFDSLGLIAAMSVLDSATTGAGTNAPAASGDFAVSGTGISFSVTRTVTVLLFAQLAAQVTNSSGGIIAFGANVLVKTPGQANSLSGAVGISGAAATNVMGGSAAIVQTLSLPAGSYTSQIYWHSFDATSTLNVYAAGLWAFQLGS